MNRVFFSLISLLFFLPLQAKSPSPADYIYPVLDVDRLYSANFGELRTDHFHSGIDIKTNGEIGKKIVAVADGYISRIAVSPYGYGLALYVAHPNGTTSVYAHLSRFTSEVSKYVEQERYRTRNHTANLYCTPTQFVVKQGDVIAYSGNSGSSAGPHLHFEIRDSGTQSPINVVAAGIIEPRDNIAPKIFTLHYIEVDSMQGIMRQADRRSFNVVKSGNNYVVEGGGAISVGRQGYFVVEVSDRRNDVSNTFGVHRITAAIDGSPFYEYVMDGFSYSNTRYCNAIGYYPIMIKSRNEVFRLSTTEHTDPSHYTKLVNGGIVRVEEGAKRQLSIEVEDDMGNISQAQFSLVGRPADKCFVAREVDPSMIINVSQQFNYKGDEVSVLIPAKTLYESTLFTCEQIEKSDSTHLSNSFDILDVQTPLHTSMTLSLVADVPFELQPKVGVVCVGRSGKPGFIGGEYRYGSVTAKSRSGGRFYVVADTTPPVLKLGISNGSNQGSSSYFTCSISDDLSGVKSYTGTIDGEWIALDLDKGKLRHNFRNKPTGAEHTLVIEAEDGVGNKSSVTCKFIR